MSDKKEKKKSKMFGGILGGKKKKKSKDYSDNGIDEDSSMQISGPMNVKHEWHVGFDQHTGDFVGLPPSWEAWLQNSNIRYSDHMMTTPSPLTLECHPYPM